MSLAATLNASAILLSRWVAWKDARGTESPAGVDEDLRAAARTAAKDASAADDLFAQAIGRAQKASVRSRWIAWRQSFASSKLHLVHLAAAGILEYHGDFDEAAELYVGVLEAAVAGAFWGGGRVDCSGPAPSRLLALVPRSFEDMWCQRGIDAQLIVAKHREAASHAFRICGQRCSGMDTVAALFARAKAALPTAITWETHEQLPTMFTPGLPSVGIWPRAQHPSWLKQLESISADITANLTRMLEVAGGELRWSSGIDGFLLDQDHAPDNAWSEWPLFDGGRWFRSNCAPFADACKLLAALPGATGTLSGVDGVVGHTDGGFIRGTIKLFRMRPGTRLKPHHGITNARLTAHLGLITPPGPELTVAGETVTWKRGEVRSPTTREPVATIPFACVLAFPLAAC